MAKGISRAINTDQIKLREHNVVVSSAGVVSGPSKRFITCNKTGTGVYVLTIQNPFLQAAIVKSAVIQGADHGLVKATSTSASTVTIATADEDAVAADRAFSICILGSDFRHYL
jgi:hypothetical protein